MNLLATIMLYAGSVVITVWGIAHIVPTKSVIAGFEPLTEDNRRILIMEWVSAGLTLCFIGVLAFSVTVIGPRDSVGSLFALRGSAVMLLIMAFWTLVTGGRTSTVQFKICPMVKTAVAALFLVGSAL
ncbi:MAG: hypothetical protein AMS21_06065 [Gemmatimonas sp. SG8_38_2]|nr:MAG: hypothetical protein AMS21_06065 [Gemmatimonas sp. SG8_38_2]